MTKISKNLLIVFTQFTVVIILLFLLVSLSSCASTSGGGRINVYSEKQKVQKPELESPTPPSTVNTPTSPKVSSHPAGCDIKGNISENGRIYHLPGQKYYDATIIDTSKGERWFCTESEASQAGWRKSKV